MHRKPIVSLVYGYTCACRQSKLRGGSTNPNAYNQFLMTDHVHVFCLSLVCICVSLTISFRSSTVAMRYDHSFDEADCSVCTAVRPWGFRQCGAMCKFPVRCWYIYLSTSCHGLFLRDGITDFWKNTVVILHGAVQRQPQQGCGRLLANHINPFVPVLHARIKG